MGNKFRNISRNERHYTDEDYTDDTMYTTDDDKENIRPPTPRIVLYVAC